MDTPILRDIVINGELEAVQLDSLKIDRNIATKIADMFPEAPGVTDAIENSIRVEPGTTLLHKNYMHYLMLAWSNHFSVIISPDIVFYTVLCELASEIKEKPDQFRHLFTNSTEKKKIRTLTGDPTKIDLEQVIKGISSNMAVDSSLFTANFSSSTNESRLAMNAAFCDAMSPYYYYSCTRCGIPRIKMLGTKEDWSLLEQKVYKMATEVFVHEADVKTSVVSYLKRVVNIVQKMQTDTSEEFWKDIFKIAGCRSGHTDFVQGWILELYRKCNGDDYYNYEAHVSLVDYKNIDVQKEYQLRTGLLYSVINRGTSELDAKFPWLEPQFAHIVLEKGKMNPDQYKTYIKNVLSRDNYTVFMEFFDVIKDDPIEYNPKRETEQYIEIVCRQLDHWIAHPEELTEIDFNTKRFDSALSSYSNDTSQYESHLLKVLEKIKMTFDTCQLKRVILSTNKYGSNLMRPYEPQLIKYLIGNPFLEELSIIGYNENDDSTAITSLYELLVHENCRLKSLKITGDPILGHGIRLADALLKAPVTLEHLSLDGVIDMQLADVIYDMATKKSLKKLTSSHVPGYIEPSKRILLAMAHSRTLEECNLFSTRSYHDDKIDLAGLYEDIAKNLCKNSCLTTVSVDGWKISDEMLDAALSNPSLKNITTPGTVNMSFLKHTTHLQSLTLRNISKKGADAVAEYLQSETCQLQSLKVVTCEDNEALAIIAEGLIDNKSLCKLFLNGNKKSDRETALGENLALALKNGIPLKTLELLDYIKISPIGVENLLGAFINHPYLETVVGRLCKVATNQGRENLIELVRSNKIMKKFYFYAYHVPAEPWTDDQKRQLIEALNTNTTLREFANDTVSYNEYKLPNDIDD